MPDHEREPPIDRLLRSIFIALGVVGGVALLLFVGLIGIGAAIGGD